MTQMITASKTPRAITVIGYCLLVIVLASCSGDGSKMRAQLEELERQNRADSVMTNDSLAEQLVKYFDRHGTPNERMRAHYILGRTYADMGEAPQALEEYHTAIECADTTANDCNYHTLSRVYSQMASVFHQQNLPQDELKALARFIHYIQVQGDTLQALRYQALLIKPYYLLGEKDTVLSIIARLNEQLENRGYHTDAVRNLGTAIYIYTERGQLAEAGRLLETYERESGMFDSMGNIVRGAEGHYWVKGNYELSINQIDSAEYYFRKAIQYGNIDAVSNAYKGMIAVYRHKQNLDSVVYYSHLNEVILDSLHNRMQTDAIHQAASLYDYTRSLKLAEQEARKRRETQILSFVLLFTAALVLAVQFRRYRRKLKERQVKYRQLYNELTNVKAERQSILEELDSLKARQYDEIIERKEHKNLELLQRITELETVIGRYKMFREGNHYEEFKSSQVALQFEKMASFRKNQPLPSKADWEILEKQFRNSMPDAYSTFCEHGLSPLEIRTCILLILNHEESVISGLTQSSGTVISTAKSRANKKLFNRQGASSLKYNLMRLIDAV